MKALVTGGLGFIGSYIVDELVNQGVEVWVVDSDDKNYRNVGHVTITPIQDYSPPDGIIFDQIYHCASPVGILGILKNHGTIIADITDGVRYVTNLAAIMGSRLILISTSEVYGQPGWLDENAICHIPSTGTPRNEYQIGKLAGDIIALTRIHQEILDAVIVRPFNIMGQRQSAGKGFVIPRLFSAALKGEPMEIFYDGHQKRAFCHVSDFVKALNILASHNYVGIYNIGNPFNIISILTLAQKIKALTKSRSPLIFIDPESRFNGFVEGNEKLPRIEKIQRLGWSPNITLDSALEQYLSVAEGG